VGQMDIALLLLRVIVGLLVAGHGSGKLFGWFMGPGLAGFTGWTDSMGLRPARFWAVLGGLAEYGGGMLLVLGLFGPLGSLGIAASMLTAIAKAHWPRIWVTENGMELPLTNLAAAAVVGIAGPGVYSLDALLGTALPGSVAIAALALTLAGVVAGLVVSRRPVEKETTPRTVGAGSKGEAA
jgi:putative oxidoreductase